MSEQDIIKLARQGDQAAFTTLVQTYQTAIYNLCYRMLGEADQAQDATQETFLRAYTQFHRYDAERSFKTWLFSIASHYCIDRLRRRRVTWLDIDDEPLAGHPMLREKRVGPRIPPPARAGGGRPGAARDPSGQGPRGNRHALLVRPFLPGDRRGHRDDGQRGEEPLHRARAAMADSLQAKDVRPEDADEPPHLARSPGRPALAVGMA
jgi:RNA polymerase sigma factor (sigma-70 family)